MTRFSLKAAAALTLAASASAQVYTLSGKPYTVTQDTGADVPLASKHFDYPYLPYKADSGDGPRGIMTGYNICNSSTLGPTSMCATAFMNSLEDFCVWGAPGVNEIVADVEGEMVAFCTTSAYGTRQIPAGAIQGVQFIQTPGYVQVVGMIDQTALNLQAADYGGEEDNKGADGRGNPLGSLVYTSAFGAGPSSPYKQVKDWSYFVGGGVFCFKACDPAGPNSARLCEHVYDRIGCTYNAPSNYGAINGTFQSCKGGNQLPVGVYVGENGRTSTWYQPPESEGPISTVPYTPFTPSSSQCSSFTSASVFTDVASAASSSAASSAASTSAPAASSGAANNAASQSSSSGALASFEMAAGAALLAAVGGVILVL